MRTVSITLALVASLALVLFSSCTITVKENKSTKLTGETVKVTRACEPFDKITMSGGLDIKYIEDDSCYVEIEADKALNAKVSTEVTDGILNIAILQTSFDGNIFETDDKAQDDRTFTFHGMKDAIDKTLDDDIKVIVKSFDDSGRVTLSHKELLGTWEENASFFNVGETVSGIARSIEIN